MLNETQLKGGKGKLLLENNRVIIKGDLVSIYNGKEHYVDLTLKILLDYLELTGLNLKIDLGGFINEQ